MAKQTASVKFVVVNKSANRAWAAAFKHIVAHLMNRVEFQIMSQIEFQIMSQVRYHVWDQFQDLSDE